MLPETVVGMVEPAADDAGALATAEAVAGEAVLAAAVVAGAALGALLEGVVVELAAVPLLLLHAATSEATTSSTPTEVFFTLTISISIRNPPPDTVGRPIGIKRFSDRSSDTVERSATVVKVTTGSKRQSICNRYQHRTALTIERSAGIRPF
ncbi:MAG TPA: hypothetical protein VII50_02520 [Acidothermaceae bacterium]